MDKRWSGDGPQCGDAGVLSAPLREPDLPQAAQAGGSERSGVPCESTLLLPGINTCWGLGLTAHTFALPSLLSCNCHRSSLTILFNKYVSAAVLWVISCIYCCILGERYNSVFWPFYYILFKWETIDQAPACPSVSVPP